MNRLISVGELRLALRLIVKHPILSITIILALLFPLGVGRGRDAAVDVLRHDDAHVGHVPDRDGEPSERHDVAVNAEQVHQDECERDREG